MSRSVQTDNPTLVNSSCQTDPPSAEECSDSVSVSPVETIIIDDSPDELLQSSKAFFLLKSRIVDKYPKIKEEEPAPERSSFQIAFEQERPKSSNFKMCPLVRSRLTAIDKDLESKMSLASPVTVLQPFLKAPDARFYHTDLIPDVSAHESLLTSMVGIFYSKRLKNLQSSKVGFSFSELDSV